MSDLVSLIESAHPGTRVYNLDGYDDILSMLPMWEQVDYFRKIMLPIFENSTNEGVNMICFSQGQGFRRWGEGGGEGGVTGIQRPKLHAISCAFTSTYQ